MARMIPETPAPGTESRAELQMFEHLRAEVASEFVAFHHVAWLVPNRHAAPSQGEADFVVAHPTLGLTVLEVKGGGIRHDAQSGAWFSQGRDGDHLIQDPFEQARRSAFRLRDALRVAKGSPLGDVRVGHAVVFPDSVVDRVPLRPDAPREIVIDGADLDQPQRSLDRVLRYWRDPAAPGLGPAGLKIVERILANSFVLRKPLGLALNEAQRELMRLTERQYQVLDLLARQTRAAIGGCAGSGKTFLAAEKARRLAAQGFRVLVLCYNRFLAEYLRRSLADVAEIDVFAFDDLCKQITDEAGRPVAGADGMEPEYWQRLRQEFAEASAGAAGRYGALIIDEGQDFQPDWWLPLQILLEEPDRSPLYIFFDDNQRIFPVPEGLPVPREPFPLTVNCRNTQQINRLVAHYYKGETLEALGPAGVPVDRHFYANSKDLLAQLDVQIRRWIGEADIAPDDIVLLTPHSADNSALWRVETLGGVKLTDDPWARGRILRSSVHKFKGLERLVVAFVEIDAATERLLYVGFSRPSVFLSVFCPDSARKRLPRAFTRPLDS